MRTIEEPEITRIDWDFATIPGWNATQQMWDEWDDIAGEEFEVSSDYTPLDSCVAAILSNDYFD